MDEIRTQMTQKPKIKRKRCIRQQVYLRSVSIHLHQPMIVGFIRWENEEKKRDADITHAYIHIHIHAPGDKQRLQLNQVYDSLLCLNQSHQTLFDDHMTHCIVMTSTN
jgi:hypothetical protein